MKLESHPPKNLHKFLSLTKLPVSELMRIAHLFAKQMGLGNHQWVAVTHKNTDNRHLQIIANRISLYGDVYDK